MKIILRIISIAFSLYILYGCLFLKSWKWDKQTFIGLLTACIFAFIVYYLGKIANSKKNKM